MDKNINKNEERFEKLIREFVHHKGLGGTEAHPVVDSWEAGFMSPEMLDQLKQGLGQVKNLITEGDARNLEAGLYPMYAEDVTGLPSNDNFYLVDVSQYGKYKNILAYRTASNEIYSKTFDRQGEDGYGIAMWGKITRDFELYRGAFETKNKVGIELPEKISSFDEIEILYVVGSNDFSIKLSANGLVNSTRTIVGSNAFNNKTALQIIEVDLHVDDNNPKKLLITDFRGMTIGKDFANDTSADNSLQIYKIIGRR